MPALLRFASAMSRMVRSPSTGTSVLGSVSVYGARRRPAPAASTIPITGRSPSGRSRGRLAYPWAVRPPAPGSSARSAYGRRLLRGAMKRLALLTACLAFGAAAPARADLVLQREPGAARGALLERAGVEPAGAVTGLARVEVVRAGDGRQRRALAALRGDPAVAWAEPVRRRSVQAETRPWGIAKVAAPAAWLTTRGAGATVAVVDTGADLTHPDLAARLTGNPGERDGGRESNGIDDDGNGLVDDWRGWDFAAGDATPSDGHGHG